jgi:proteasome lid subunit RPN8/RPN11
MNNTSRNNQGPATTLAHFAKRWVDRTRDRSAELASRVRTHAKASLLHLLQPSESETDSADASVLIEAVLPASPAQTKVVAPSSYHDTSGAPSLVRVNQGVLDRLAAEFSAHRCTEDGRNETGWVPVGYVDETDGSVAVTGLISKGPGAHASPAAFEIDHAYVYAALLLFRSSSRDSVVGLIHSHPDGMHWNSEQDLATDRRHVRTLRSGVGIYPILNHARLRTEHQLSLETRLSWWSMSAERPGVYTPRLPQVLPGDDEAAWVEDRAEALGHAAKLVSALQSSGLDVKVQPVADDDESLDVVASFGDRHAIRRYDPFPGPVVLLGPTKRLRLTDPDPNPAVLAAKLLELLSSLEVGDEHLTRAFTP